MAARKKITQGRDEKKKEERAAKETSAKVKEPVVVRSKRKEAVSRAYIRKGNGIVRINGMNIAAINNQYVKSLIMEPLSLADDKLVKSVDIDINVYGGGVMGQAQAARSAIARALVAYTNDMGLREKFYKTDKFLVVEDSRRVEPKKYKGPKARARFQKSYR
ncbi:MAG: 30S ribosomal protein S9 [Candidatus Micrarchaeia archaeon]